MSPFLAWGDFHAHSRFTRSAIPEENWGTTRSLIYGLSGHFVVILRFCFIIFIIIIIIIIIILYFLEKRMSSPFLCFWSICY